MFGKMYADISLIKCWNLHKSKDIYIKVRHLHKSANPKIDICVSLISGLETDMQCDISIRFINLK